jgi:hypothetical protein
LHGVIDTGTEIYHFRPDRIQSLLHLRPLCVEIEYRGVHVGELGVHGGHRRRQIGESFGLILQGSVLAVASEDDRRKSTGQIRDRRGKVVWGWL